MATPRPRFPRLLLTVLATVLVSVPTAVWASHRFTDVPDSHTFHNAIDWLADSGVTVGCNPPVNDQFCPDDNVTRAQMAAFLKRLAENQVVDADTVDGLQGNQLLTTSDPVDADTVDGIDSTGFLSASDPVDAETLDGIDSTGFLDASDPVDAETLDGIDSTGFLGAGPVVLSMPPTAWVPNGTNGPSQFTVTPGGADISSGSVLMTLPTPAIIGGIGYGLDQLEFCYSMSDPTIVIDQVALYRLTASGNDAPFGDGTNRNQGTLACDTLDTNVLPGKGLIFEVFATGPGTVRLTSVTATWTPDVTGFS